MFTGAQSIKLQFVSECLRVIQIRLFCISVDVSFRIYCTIAFHRSHQWMFIGGSVYLLLKIPVEIECLPIDVLVKNDFIHPSNFARPINFWQYFHLCVVTELNI